MGPEFLKFKRAGFFSEHVPAISNESIHRFIRDTPHPDELKIISYLAGGKILLGSPGVAMDEISPSTQPIGPTNQPIGVTNVLTFKMLCWHEPKCAKDPTFVRGRLLLFHDAAKKTRDVTLESYRFGRPS